MNQLKSKLNLPSKLIFTLELKIFTLAFLAFFLFYRAFPLTRIGDGSEYILQYEAIVKGHRTWITKTATQAYDLVFNRHEIAFMVNSSQIQSTFPSLKTGSGFDLNHFWLYSALAGLVHLAFLILFLNVSVAYSFIILHSILFGLLILVAWKKFRFPGVVSVLVLLTVSPIFWYGNKIHTEFFTFSLVTLATILVCSAEYGFAAISLATASTQNPSFAAIACLMLIIHFIIFTVLI